MTKSQPPWELTGLRQIILVTCAAAEKAAAKIGIAWSGNRLKSDSLSTQLGLTESPPVRPTSRGR